MTHSPDWVNVLALTPDARLVLVRQFRFGIDDFSLEIPGGVIETGEDPVAAGLRELREETGYGGRADRLLASSIPTPRSRTTAATSSWWKASTPTARWTGTATRRSRL